MKTSRTLPAITQVFSPSSKLSRAVCVVLGVILTATAALATDLTWTGAVSSDWNNPTNWIPQQIPTATDHVIINSGSVTVPTSAAFAIMDWRGGSISGSLTVASNGVLNLNGGSDNLLLGGTLTNAGTVMWLGGNLILDGCGYAPGPIVILAGGLWDIQCDRTLRDTRSSCGCCLANSYFQNAGTVRKSASTGVTTISIPFKNSGTVAALQGTLTFDGGGSFGGLFNAAAGATINFNGSFTSGAAPVLNGPGAIQFTGGTLTLLNDVIPNLQMVAGTLVLGPSFQGGTITNLTLNGMTLNGNYTVSGTLNCGNGLSGSLLVAGGATLGWTGGTVAGSLVVASNGVLNLNGGSDNLLLGGTLTNAGTVMWLGGNLILDGCGYAPGPIVILAGGLWDIQCDRTLRDTRSSCGCCLANSYFQNAGTVRKSASTGTTSINIPFYNTGTIEAQTGTITFNGGYSGGSSANLAISLGGTAPASGYGQIAFSNPLDMIGAFTVSTRNGFRPNPGDTVQVLSYPSAAGEFPCFSGLDLGSGLLLLPEFAATGLTLRTSTYTTNDSQPQLFITRSPTGLRVTWPLGFPSWVLQSTTNPASLFWSPVPVVCGNQVLVPVTAPSQFFRLKQ